MSWKKHRFPSRKEIREAIEKLCYFESKLNYPNGQDHISKEAYNQFARLLNFIDGKKEYFGVKLTKKEKLELNRLNKSLYRN